MGSSKSKNRDIGASCDEDSQCGSTHCRDRMCKIECNDVPNRYYGASGIPTLPVYTTQETCNDFWNCWWKNGQNPNTEC